MSRKPTQSCSLHFFQIKCFDDLTKLKIINHQKFDRSIHLQIMKRKIFWKWTVCEFEKRKKHLSLWITNKTSKTLIQVTIVWTLEKYLKMEMRKLLKNFHWKAFDVITTFIEFQVYLSIDARPEFYPKNNFQKIGLQFPTL